MNEKGTNNEMDRSEMVQEVEQYQKNDSDVIDI